MKICINGRFFSYLSCLALFSIPAMIFPATNSLAQDKKQGWSYGLNLTFGGNFNENKSVVGQSEGSTQTYTGRFGGELNNVSGTAEWDNSLLLSEAFSETPTLPRLIKTDDKLHLKSDYKWFLQDLNWLAAYGKFEANSNALATYDERAGEVTYQIFKSNGDVVTRNSKRQKLTTSLQPMTLKESVGALARLSKEKAHAIEMRAGAAAKQIMLKNQYTLADVKGTDTIEIGQYSDNIEVVGTEIAAELKGLIQDDRIKYRLYAEALYPVSYKPKQEPKRSADKLISTEIGASLGYNLWEWMALVYEAKVIKEPLIQDKAQVKQAVLLTASFATTGTL